jgi:hypothetical protein
VHATIRRYQGNADLANQLAARKDEVISLISGAQGFRAYYLVQAGGDTISVTVCDDQTGTQQSNDLAAGWIRESMPELSSSAPEISEGEVVVSA